MDVQNEGGANRDWSSGTASVEGGCGASIANQVSRIAGAFNPDEPQVNDNTEFTEDMADKGYNDGGTVCYNAQCAQIACDQANTTDPCTGNASLYSSPIVLALGAEQPYTVVQFPLNPEETKSWVIWKGSSTHPLLVYDPAGSGVIKDGSQLFGNYTFRGTGKAPSGKASHNQLWANGYDALASLDRNKDGYLTDSNWSGLFPDRSELQGLALWFDDNRNAISEPGEVRPLGSIGLVKLKTSFDNREHDGDLVSVNGFEQVDTSGITTQGNTLDWFSGGYADKESALRGFLKESPNTPRDVDLSSTGEPNIAASRSSSGPSLDGHWVWEMDDEKGRGGRFVLIERGNGLFGATMLEFRANQPSGGSVGRVDTFLLASAKQDAANGKVAFEFETHPQPDTLSTSRGEFDPETGLIKATSEVSSGGNKITYSWHAMRVRVR